MTASLPIRIEPIPAFDDNYLWWLSNGRSAAIVDPGDAGPVAQRLSQTGQQLCSILVTHHHGDHVGGVEALVQATGAHVYGPAAEAIPCVRTHVKGGDRIRVLGHEFEVLDVPGHTSGHVAYYAPSLSAVFCGDTLFACGCGRLFEGTAAQMTDSLARLAALPAETRVYCAHEYTLANIRFALAVEPDNAGLRARQQACAALRAAGKPTLPSTIAEERATNPFLRCDEPGVRARAERESPGAGASTVTAFAALRAWKNRF